jgi:hypothetical protein
MPGKNIQSHPPSKNGLFSKREEGKGTGEDTNEIRKTTRKNFG